MERMDVLLIIIMDLAAPFGVAGNNKIHRGLTSRSTGGLTRPIDVRKTCGCEM